MAEPIVWGGLTRSELDAGYNNMVAVADSEQRLAAWSERSQKLRALQPAEVDIAYGGGPRNRFDVFRSGAAKAPLVVFIHGGWWQRNSKEVFSCVAEGPMEHGIDVALVGYTLAPDATLREISVEIRTALDAIVTYQAARGGSTRLILSGWSAGGHLTALTMDHPAVVAGLSISGVFDMEPIRHSYINDKLRLGADDVNATSPIRRPLVHKPMTIAFGTAELSEMQRQSTSYCAFLRDGGVQTECLALDGLNHFSIVEEMIRPTGALAKVLRDLAGQAG